jgi:hypothetical protein
MDVKNCMSNKTKQNKKTMARCWWLMPVILAIWEAEIQRQIFYKTPSPK